MKRLLPYLSLLKNKYIISVIIFAVWIIFLDKNNLINQQERQEELHKLQTGEKYFEDAIAQTRKDLGDLQNNTTTIEKYAREHFFMKKDNEDIFLIPESADVSATK